MARCSTGVLQDPEFAYFISPICQRSDFLLATWSFRRGIFTLYLIFSHQPLSISVVVPAMAHLVVRLSLTATEIHRVWTSSEGSEHT